MDLSDPPAATDAPEDPKAEVRRAQRLRKKRLGMSILSYLMSCMVVAFCCYQKLLPWEALQGFVLATFVINAAFWVTIDSGANLAFKDPSMTALQMVVSVLPAAWVIYIEDSGHVRAVFLLLSVAPSLFGVLALNTRQFMVANGLIFLIYGLLMMALWRFKPHVLNGPVEVLQSFAFFVVLFEMTLMGGYIHRLRSKLHKRNAELNKAMADLNNAMFTIGDMAIRDSLTGSYNRRHLLDMLTKEASRANRSKSTFSIALVNVDNFQQLNVQYGDQAGDTMLCTISKEIESRLRNIDGFGRYGGGEFLVILAQSSLDGALIKAERIREQVENLRFSTADGTWQATVSVGVSEFHCGEDSVEELMARASAALKRAKSNGHNQVISVVDEAELGFDQGLQSALASPRT